MTESADDESLTEAFWGVARQLRRLSMDALARWDIAPSHARALRVLNRHGVMRLSELSEHLRIAPRSTTEVVDALEERDLARRRPDPADRRATLVALTEQGSQVSVAMREARSSGADELFATLSRSDRLELLRILRVLAPADAGIGG